MKKLLIVLSLVLAMLLLASCQLPNFGGNTDDGTNEGEKNEGEGENQEQEGEQNGDPNCAHETLLTDRAQKPTCTEAGFTAKVYCLDCGYVETASEVIPATGHTKVAIPATEATCMAPGATAGVRCTACNQTLVTPVEIPQLAHVEIKSADVPATCTTQGSVGGTHCAKCFTTIQAPTEIIPAFGHDRGLDHIVVTKEAQAPTCKDEGWTEEVSCLKCESVIISSKTIGCSEHLAEDLEVVLGYAVTCTSEGLTDGEFCTFCGVTTIEQVEIPIDPTAHPEDMLVVLDAVAVTCYADGLTEGSHCTACDQDAVAQVAITERPAHTMIEFAPAVAPDCATETDGHTNHMVCDFEGCDYEETPVVIPYGHVHGEWTVTVEASAGVAGEKYTHCTVCDKLIEEQIPALPEADDEDGLPDYTDPDGVV